MVEETLKQELVKNASSPSEVPVLRKRLQIFERITLTKTSGKKKGKKASALKMSSQ
jgi:hypothetical protein